MDAPRRGNTMEGFSRKEGRAGKRRAFAKEKNRLFWDRASFFGEGTVPVLPYILLLLHPLGG